MKLSKKRGRNIDKLKIIIADLANEVTLSPKHRDHALYGNFANHRECHIEPDWLLIYKKENGALILERLGTHADLFK